MTERFVRKLFTAEVMGAVLVITALQILVYGISTSLQNPASSYFSAASLIAASFAWEFGKRNSKLIHAAVGIVALGASSVWITGARLFIPLLNFLWAAISLIPQALSFIQTWIVQFIPVPGKAPLTSIDTSALTQAWFLIVEPSLALAARFQAWFVGWQNHTTINDTLVRNTIWLFLLWLVAAWTGWLAARRNAILALLPSMVLLTLVASYSAHKAETICGMVVILLLLMGLWNYKGNLRQWEKRRVDYAESIAFDNTQAILVLTLTVGTLAFITPSISWLEIRDALRERQQSKNEIADALGLQQKSGTAPQVLAPTPVLPRDYLLGGEVANSEKIVMTIRTGELPPLPPQAVSIPVPRHYWRSVIYDDYVGSGWLTSVYFGQKYAANTPLIPGLLNGYKSLHLDVQMEEPAGHLFWSGTLFSADVPTTMEWRVKPTTGLFADQASLLQADLFAASTRATSYHAESYVPDVSVETLRTASRDYPEQIRNRYLELPSVLPDRVSSLAKQITSNRSNPYDKAKAIEAYLRRNYPYDLNIPAPPSDQDVADYFLFDLKRGYCDYYATAMVVLARASGLPARFVSGYSSGSYDAPNAQYIVREMNAHSWVEVYFPQIGWIEFEPTASQPEIDRTKTDEINPLPQKTDTTASNQLFRLRFERIGYIVFPITMLVVMILLYFTVIERWWYLSLAPAFAIEHIYQNFYKRGRPLAGERGLAETPHEFMHKVIRRFDELKKRSWLSKLIARPQMDAQQLTDVYQESLFGRNQINRNDVRYSLKSWKRLRQQLIIGKIASHKIFEHHQ